jgi:hypothetical protein
MVSDGNGDTGVVLISPLQCEQAIKVLRAAGIVVASQNLICTDSLVISNAWR